MNSSDDERDDFREDESARTLALFRYGVLGPVVEGEECARGELSQRIAEQAARTHYLPGKGPVRVSTRTIYTWLKRYRTGGIEALRPKLRKDRGQLRALDEQLLRRAIELRKEQPKRFTSTLLDILAREGSLSGKSPPHRSTLDRHLSLRAASRRHLKTLGEKRTIKMHFEQFGDLWVGDYKHGPLVRLPDHRLGRAKLSAFLDHTTRYPVSHRFYGSEQLATLRDTLMRGFLVFGIPAKTYVDRGSVYRSDELAYSLMRVDSKLVHSRPYYSQGRGVIERWWQLADAFIAEVETYPEPPTLHELNRLWKAFCELRYCDVVHSELGCTPNQALATITRKPLDPAVARELFLCGCRRKVDKRDACVSVLGRRFLCESYLRRQQVTVRYDPSDLSSVLIFHNGKRVQKAFPQPKGGAPEPHPTPAVVRQSVDYLELLRGDYDKRLLEQTRPVAYSDFQPDERFDAERFIAVVCELAGLRPDIESARRELHVFYDTFAPLSEDLVRIATEHAVRLHTRGRHVRVYLNSIRTLHLAQLKSAPKDVLPS